MALEEEGDRECPTLNSHAFCASLKHLPMVSRSRERITGFSFRILDMTCLSNDLIEKTFSYSQEKDCSNVVQRLGIVQ